MGIQIVAKANTSSEIEAALGHIASDCEVFSIETGEWGISIPTKIINVVGQEYVDAALTKLEHFDLWAGTWKPATTD